MDSQNSDIDYQYLTPIPKTIPKTPNFEHETRLYEEMLYNSISEFDFQIMEHQNAIQQNWKVIVENSKTVSDEKKFLKPFFKKFKKYEATKRVRNLSKNEQRRMERLRGNIEMGEVVIDFAQEKILKSERAIKSEETSMKFKEHVVERKKKLLRNKRSNSV